MARRTRILSPFCCFIRPRMIPQSGSHSLLTHGFQSSSHSSMVGRLDSETALISLFAAGSSAGCDGDPLFREEAHAVQKNVCWCCSGAFDLFASMRHGKSSVLWVLLWLRSCIRCLGGRLDADAACVFRLLSDGSSDQLCPGKADCGSAHL